MEIMTEVPFHPVGEVPEGNSPLVAGIARLSRGPGDGEEPCRGDEPVREGLMILESFPAELPSGVPPDQFLQDIVASGEERVVRRGGGAGLGRSRGTARLVFSRATCCK